MDPIPAVIGIAVATTLLGAIGVLWRRQEKSDKAGEAREAAAAQREKDCNARNEKLGEEIKATKAQLTEVYKQRAEHAEAKAEANAKLALTCATVLRRYEHTPLPEAQSGGTSAIHKALVLLVALFLFSGCSEERTEGKTTTDAQVQRDESITVSGTVTIPTAAGAFDLPINLHVERTVTETKTQVASNQSRTTKQIDAAALAQQLGGALGQSLNVALAKITGGVLGGQASGLGFLGTPEGAVTTSGFVGAALYGVQQALARRRERKESDALWDEIHQRARRAPPAPEPEKATT